MDCCEQEHECYSLVLLLRSVPVVIDTLLLTVISSDFN